MNINYPFLSFGWLGGALLGITGSGGYLIYDYKNPTGGKRLLGRGYIFKPPKITGSEINDNGCFENIFKEITGLDNGKLYACSAANIDIWNNVGQFEPKDKTINFLSFVSEIYMRQGDEGWKIVTTFDNRAGGAVYSHKVSIYKKYEKNDWKETSKFMAMMDEIPEEKQDKSKISLGNKSLNIKIPEGHWYKGINYFVGNEDTFDLNEYGGEMSGSFKERKTWSGIWIQDDRSNSSWIFQDIEIFIEDKKYSQLFCKTKENCYKLRDKELDPWFGQKQHKKIIQEIENKKGKWEKTEEFCRRSRLRNLQDKELKDLELFCFSKQN